MRKIEIHPVFWAVFAIAIATAHFLELLVLLVIILIHEIGHAVAASFFSWRVRKISLLPFGGVAEMDEHGNRPLREEGIVILAGPAQHLWMIGLAFLVFQGGWLSEEAFFVFLKYNLMILFFNMLPIWPLDGGKLLFLYVSLKLPFSKAFQQTLAISAGAVAVFAGTVLLIEPLNLNIWIVLSFLAFSLYFERKQSRYTFMRFLMERYYGKNEDLRKLKPLVVPHDALVVAVLEQFQRGCKHPIIIEQNGKEKGTLDENELLHAFFTEKLVSAKVGDLLYDY